MSERLPYYAAAWVQGADRPASEYEIREALTLLDGWAIDTFRPEGDGGCYVYVPDDVHARIETEGYYETPVLGVETDDGMVYVVFAIEMP
jgi:hypothetical protein